MHTAKLKLNAIREPLKANWGNPSLIAAKELHVEAMARKIMELTGATSCRGYAVKRWRGSGPGIDRHVLCNQTKGEFRCVK